MIRDARHSRSGSQLTRKDMKGPDRFQVGVQRFLEWASARGRSLMLALAILVLVGVAAAVIAGTRSSQRAAAGGALYQALDDAAGAISSVPLPGVDRKIYPTPEARARAVLDAANRVRREHPGTRAAMTAALVAADAELTLRDYEPAIGDFQAYLASAPPDDSLRFFALDGLARAQEGKGELAAAAQSFARAGQEAPEFRDRAALDQARVLALAGKQEEARKILADFPTEYADSPLKGEAQQRLAKLGGK
jgi:tetratricopeptide (TPR) repeat protein